MILIVIAIAKRPLSATRSLSRAKLLITLLCTAIRKSRQERGHAVVGFDLSPADSLPVLIVLVHGKVTFQASSPVISNSDSDAIFRYNDRYRHECPLFEWSASFTFKTLCSLRAVPWSRIAQVPGRQRETDTAAMSTACYSRSM